MLLTVLASDLPQYVGLAKYNGGLIESAIIDGYVRCRLSGIIQNRETGTVVLNNVIAEFYKYHEVTIELC